MALLPTTKNTQTLRPFPQFGNVSIIATDEGQSSYNALNAGIKKRYAGGFQYGLNYTWSKFIDNQESRNELANYNAGILAPTMHSPITTIPRTAAGFPGTIFAIA